MIPKYVERRQVEEASGAVQLSSIFKAGGRDYALLADTANNKTILAICPQGWARSSASCSRAGTHPRALPSTWTWEARSKDTASSRSPTAP